MMMPLRPTGRSVADHSSPESHTGHDIEVWSVPEAESRFEDIYPRITLGGVPLDTTDDVQSRLDRNPAPLPDSVGHVDEVDAEPTPRVRPPGGAGKGISGVEVGGAQPDAVTDTELEARLETDAENHPPGVDEVAALELIGVCAHARAEPKVPDAEIAGVAHLRKGE